MDWRTDFVFLIIQDALSRQPIAWMNRALFVFSTVPHLCCSDHSNPARNRILPLKIEAFESVLITKVQRNSVQPLE
jgi:hypothetical protein